MGEKHNRDNKGGCRVTWTTETPTKAGPYWLKQGAMVSLVSVEAWHESDRVVLHEGEVIAMQPGDWIVSYFGLELPDRLEKNMGEWAGPLEPPM
jgi:hypothetical protein